MAFSYDGRKFQSVLNSGTGEVSPDTRFEYHQDGLLVWAEYRGGLVAFGQLIATVVDPGNGDGMLDARYQHVNTAGVVMTGVCRTIPEQLPDGRYRLHETWRWTCGDRSSGESVVEEIF
jgi:hypothetical protein